MGVTLGSLIVWLKGRAPSITRHFERFLPIFVSFHSASLRHHFLYQREWLRSEIGETLVFRHILAPASRSQQGLAVAVRKTSISFSFKRRRTTNTNTLTSLVPSYIHLSRAPLLRKTVRYPLNS